MNAASLTSPIFTLNKLHHLPDMHLPRGAAENATTTDNYLRSNSQEFRLPNAPTGRSVKVKGATLVASSS